MAQNPESTLISLTQNDTEEKPLQTVVNVALKYQNRFKSINISDKNYQVLYKDIKQVLNQLDSSITDCRIYNQAKTKRKYERKIQQLQSDLKMLTQKVKQLSRTRSPSKRYVEDLVNKLVFYKNQNQKLLSENQHLLREKQMRQQKSYSTLKEDEENQSTIKLNQSQLGNHSLMRSKSKGKNFKQFNLKQELSTFLREKQIQRKVLNQQQSKLQYFLKKHLKRLGQSTFGEFLRQIDNMPQKNAMSFAMNYQKNSKSDKKNFSGFLEQSHMKKLPKISNAPTSPKNLQYSVRNTKTVHKKYKNEQRWKTNINYSTLQVLGRVNEKVMLK